MAASYLLMRQAAIIIVEGMVQRVGFRRFAAVAARKWKLAGYVENMQDGRVRVMVQGEPKSIAAFAKYLKKARKPIEVDGLETKKVKPLSSLKNFRIKGGPLSLEIQEGFGAMEAQFNDYRDEFRGFTGEFRDYRKEFRDFSSRTDSNFRALEQKYGEISEKLTSIMVSLAEESKRSREMLEAIREESRQGRETLAELLRLVREAVDRLPRSQ